jgi:hypothetical protein
MSLKEDTEPAPTGTGTRSYRLMTPTLLVRQHFRLGLIEPELQADLMRLTTLAPYTAIF